MRADTQFNVQVFIYFSGIYNPIKMLNNEGQYESMEIKAPEKCGLF